MKIPPNKRIFLTGKTQSGKTTLTKRILNQYKSYIVYDVKWQYIDLGAIVHTIPALELAIKNGCSKIIYQPNTLDVEHFDELCKWIFYNVRHVLLVVEEAQSVATKHKLTPFFREIIYKAEGFPYYIGVLSIAQRPAETHNAIISQSSIIISFRHNLPSDASSLVHIPAETILSLEPFQYAVFNDADFEGKILLYKLKI